MILRKKFDRSSGKYLYVESILINLRCIVVEQDERAEICFETIFLKCISRSLKSLKRELRKFNIYIFFSNGQRGCYNLFIRYVLGIYYYRDSFSSRPPFFYFYNALSTQGKNGVRGRQGHLEHEEEKTERN